MAKGGSGFEKGKEAAMPQGAPPNGGAALPDGPSGPRARVAQMRAKLHRWAAADAGRRFDA